MNKPRRGMMSEAAGVRKPRQVPGAGGGRRRRAPTVDQVAAQTWLALSIDEQYTDKRPMWGDIRPWWRPSAMGELCDRKTVVGALGYRGDPISTQLRRIFDMGTAIEKLWQARFTKMGVLVASNVQVKYDAGPVVHGEYDVLTRHPFEDGRRLLGEIKSINKLGFSKLPPVTLDKTANFQALLDIPDKDIRKRIFDYLCQHQSYLRMTGEGEGFLLFDCKDNSDFKDYIVGYEDEFLAVEWDKLARLDPYRIDHRVPPCTCGGSHAGVCLVRPEDEISLDFLKSTLADVEV